MGGVAGHLAHLYDNRNLTFNEMAERLGAQQNDLIQAHDRLDERAQFTEAVLHGISSGVIGVDEHGRINHVNEPATRLTNSAETSLIGTRLNASFPDFADLARRARKKPGHTVSAQISARNSALKGNNLRASALAGSHAGLRYRTGRGTPRRLTAAEPVG